MLLAVVTAMPRQAGAFGAAGHRVSGQIAEALLTERTRAALGDLLGTVDLAALSVAADEQRAALAARWPESPRWHYDDRLVCHPDLRYEDYCPHDACASAAIARFRAVLADGRAPREARAEAAMFIVHLVGDIHQPLHAADNNDRGGNATRVILPGETRPRPLHAAWDVSFVERALDGRTVRTAAGDWLAAYRDRVAAYAGGSVDAWMGESYALAAEFAYGALPGFACDAAPAAPVVLPEAYVHRATELMPELLVKAGARMAAVLNAALDP